GLTGGFFWGADSRTIYFPRGGDLWSVAIGGGAPPAGWATPAPGSSMTPSPDRARAAVGRSRRGPIVRSLADGKETSVTKAEKPIGGVGWSPDGTRLLFTAGAETIRHEQTPDYSGVKIIYTISERVPGDTFLVAASGGTPTKLSGLRGFG